MGQLVHLSLGSNQGDRIANLNAAVEAICKEFGAIETISSIYQSPPWGFEAEMDFYNLCMSLKTNVTPVELLETFQSIETKLGRQKKQSAVYLSRTIDIDILSVDALVMESASLTVPHPQMHNRRFVLEPLLEIAPNFIHASSQKSISELIKECKDVTELTILRQKIYYNC